MTNRETLRSLADACEALSGPCRETDARIFGLLRLGTRPWMHADDHAERVWSPSYTESLEKSLSLVPAGWKRRVYDSDFENGGAICELFRDSDDTEIIVRAATWPLAIVAASLRAIGEGL